VPRYPLCVLILLTGAALSACAQSPATANPLGSFNVTHPSYRERPALTSISVTIDNKDSNAVGLVSLSSHCLIGSPPGSVPGSSSSAPFSVSVATGCSGAAGYFDMTYDPDASATDACTFDILYEGGTFRYLVSNGNTSCSYVPGATPAKVTFVYAKG
jgi:hypothetical protein